MGLIEKAMKEALTPEERLRRQLETLCAQNAELRAEIVSLRAENAQLKAPANTIAVPQFPLTSDNLCKNIGEKGIYFGQWEPKDRDGQSLGKTFYVFAAPEDLDKPDITGKNCRTFNDAAREVGALQYWKGHSGIYLRNDTELYSALKHGCAIGKWFIPPSDLLYGKDIDGNLVRHNHLYRYKDEGDFTGTFTTMNQSASRLPDWYWSCSEERDSALNVLNVRISDGHKGYSSKITLMISCRPCRVELAP